MSIDAVKKRLRQEMRQKRNHPIPSANSAEQAALHFLSLPLHKQSVIAIYLPLPGELDTAPLLPMLLKQGHTLALPCIKDDKTLLFRRYVPGDALCESGLAGIRQPLPASPVVLPDTILLPLLAFDRNGTRLGQGGGYYDRTLAALHNAGNHPLTIGYAFSWQEQPELPRAQHDIALDYIITEREAIRSAIAKA